MTFKNERGGRYSTIMARFGGKEFLGGKRQGVL